MEQLLTAEELGRRLRLGPDTVKLWARRGLIPSIRATSKTLRFDPSEVMRALRRRDEEVEEQDAASEEVPR